MRKPLVAAVATLALVAPIAACSTPEQNSGGDERVTTVAHQFGETEVTGIPERVVVLSNVWSDTLIELGVPITAEFLDDKYGGDEVRPEWTPEHESTVIPKAPQTVPTVAEIAKFDPDVILAGWLPDQESFERLNTVAPTVPHMSSPSGDSWLDLITTGGEIFDRTEEADDAIDKVNTRIEAMKAAYPIENKTFVFAQLTGEGQIGLVTGEDDPSTQLFRELGFTLLPAVRALSDEGARQLVSTERAELLDADLLVVWPMTSQGVADSVPGWPELKAVRQDSAILLDNDSALALGAPTVYSVPWMLDKLESAIANV